MGKTKIVFISSVTGKFVNASYAAQHPESTVRLTVPTGR
jgi:hypothetical protein